MHEVKVPGKGNKKSYHVKVSGNSEWSCTFTDGTWYGQLDVSGIFGIIGKGVFWVCRVCRNVLMWQIEVRLILTDG